MATTAQQHRRVNISRDPEENTLDDGARVQLYQQWRAFNAGEQWMDLPAAKRGEIRHTFNYARALIRKTASYVFAGPVTFSISARESSTQAETALNELVAQLGLAALDLELEIERSVIGDAAVKITWDAELTQPRVVSVDPATLSATWSADNPSRAVAMQQAYELPGYAIAPYMTEAEFVPELIYQVVENWSDQTWTIQAGDVVREVPNPYGWIPYVVLPNNPHPRRFWGSSDLVDVKSVAQALNAELTTLAKIMQLSGAPIVVLEGVDGTDGISATPGAKWELPEDSKAYLLDLLEGRGWEAHMGYLDQLRTTLHDIAESPRTAFGDSGRDLSGAALEVEIQPLVQRVRRKRLSWDHRFYPERNRRLLDLMERFGGAPIDGHRLTKSVWPDILPSDDEANVRNQTQLVSTGIRSRYSANVALGETDPDAELARIEQERKAAAAIAAANDQSSRTEPKPDDEEDDDAGTGDL